MSVIDDLVRGSIDMHVHPGPDALFERHDVLEMAREYQKAGIRAAVFKNQYPTTPTAQLVNRIVPDFTAFGSLCLDTVVGGLNPVAVTNSAKLGARVIWMPVGSAAGWRGRNGLSRNGGITTLDDEGKLRPVVGKILDIIKKYDMILATAHISFDETLALIQEARRRGIDRIVATHASLAFPIDQQVRLADAGAVVEHCCMAALSLALRQESDGHLQRSDWPMIISSIKAVGAERCIMSTDMGHKEFPSPAEGMRTAVGALLEGGLAPREVEILVKSNPARLLGLTL